MKIAAAAIFTVLLGLNYRFLYIRQLDHVMVFKYLYMHTSNCCVL